MYVLVSAFSSCQIINKPTSLYSLFSFTTPKLEVKNALLLFMVIVISSRFFSPWY